MSDMSRVAAIGPAFITHHVDQRVMLYDVGWSDFERLLEVRGDRAGHRVAYLEGALELMTPSRDHEALKTTFARLLEAYAEELGIELEGYGSWTLTRKEVERALEPDECYSIGRAGAVPDIAIEVIWTSGGLDKLEIYRLLGVREVWRWDDGVITVFALRGERYEPMARSEILPQVDVELLQMLMELPTQTAAVRELRARLRQPSRD